MPQISLISLYVYVGPASLGLQSQSIGRYLKKLFSPFYFSGDKVGLFGDF